MTHLGLIGLGTMGENLVRNIVSHDESIVVWNRTLDKVDALIKEVGTPITKAQTIAELVAHTQSPRNIILLVPAGKVTDEVAQELFSILAPGDAIWDLGNAHWDTTIAHQAEAIKHGIHWVGCGISGGSEGARLGPSLMPGGDAETVKRLLPMLEKFAAKDFAGKPCVTYVGKAAAGNFVKMVHNGIEYAMMQGIAEIYDILRDAGIPQGDIRHIFSEMNTGYLKSFLLDITVDILDTRDPLASEEFLLEKISDTAGSKGTGGWTVEAALKLGVPVPSIAEAVFARWMSGRNFTFTNQSQHKNDHFKHSADKLRLMAPNLLMVTFMSAYLQGIDLIQKAESEWHWGINIFEVLRIWQGGCIIRSSMLDFISSVLHGDESSWNILKITSNFQCEDIFTPTPVIHASQNYLRGFFAEKLPTNLIQAMRDSFGAHGVKRIGSDISESFTWK